MNPSNPRHARWLIRGTLLMATLASLGCMGPMLTAMYLMGGMDTAAEYKGLKKKTVAVVCRPLVQLKYRNMTASKDISREVAKSLQKKAGAKVISPDKVAEWLDNNASEDCLEVGRALNAEMVVGIDLTEFDIYQGPTLYQGKARYTLKVYDCKTGDVVFEKSPDPSIYPPNSAIPATDKQESQFRRQFVEVLAEEITRRFYSHDARADFAGDVTALD